MVEKVSGSLDIMNYKKKIKSFFRNSFIRNVLIMITGTAAAQIITMLFSPILTRLYGPEAFGNLGVFMAIVGIIAPVAALTYPIAIVLPKSDNHAKGLATLSIYISIVVAFLSTLVLLFFEKSIVKIFDLEDISTYLYLLPFIILFSGILQVMQQWLIRIRNFKYTAKVTSIHALLLQGGLAGIGLFYPFGFILIILNTFGQGLKAVMLSLGVLRDNRWKSNRNSSMSISKLAKRHKDFPLYRAPEVLLNSISQSLPTIMLASFFGPASAGFYSVSRMVLGAPSQLIGKSVGDVFYPRINEAALNKENITHLIKKATLSLAIVGLIPFGLVILFGPILFSFIFGSDWYMAGEYARWIALWSYCGFLNRPSVRSLPVLAAQAFHLKFTTLMVVIRVGVLLISYYVFSSDLIAIALFSVSGALLNIWLILITINISGKYDGE